jgi:hypothetical protein
MPAPGRTTRDFHDARAIPGRPGPGGPAGGLASLAVPPGPLSLRVSGRSLSPLRLPQIMMVIPETCLRPP